MSKKDKQISRYRDKKKFDNHKIYFSDIETITINDKHVPVVICILGDEIETFDNMNDFMINVTKNKKKSIIYFHNFGRFDSTFILNWIANNDFLAGNIEIIERNNIIYEISLSDFNILFRDSYLIIPISLEKIGESFCENYKKSKFEYGNINDIYESSKEEVIELCINDCLVLKEGFNNFSKLIYMQFGIKIYSYLTLPALAFNIFKKNYHDFDNHGIFKNPYHEDAFIRSSYAGGISEVFKPYLENGYCYDANSLYPYVMMNYKYPVGRGKFVKGNTIDINNFIGFIECKVEVDNELNFLTFRDSERGLITPVGTWISVYYHEEVKMAIELGYKIEFLKGFKYEESAYIFKEYVKDLYKLRKESKDKSMNSIAKLLLNSLYGRFGMKIFKESTKFIKENQLKELKSKYEIRNINYLGNGLYTVSVIKRSENAAELYRDSIDTETAVQIASAVTAYARIYMYKFKNLKNNECYYTDTDSIFVKNKIDEKYIGDEIGEFKLEYEVKEGYFIAPKVYMIVKNDDSIKTVIKGLKKSEYSVNEVLSKFKKILNNDSEEFAIDRINPFKRDLIMLITTIQKMRLNLTFPFNKRIKLIESGVWVGTRALKIKRL